MDQNILATLLMYNPWIENPALWEDSVTKYMPQAFGFPYIKRFADFRETWPQYGKVNLVIGPRQSGKSTLIWHTLSKLGPEIVYINGNELCFREWCTSQALFWSDLKDVIAKPKALFFEEVQYMENAGLFLKGLIDLREDILIFATGSSSFHLHDKIRESLAGRAERLQLFPFSLKEWSGEKNDHTPAIFEKKTLEKLNRIMVYGSYPEVCFSETPDLILNSLVESFVIRDASDTFHVRYPAKFRKLLSLMASQIGKLVNFSDWSSLCGLDIKTTESYANILQESHIIKLLPPFVGGKRAEITSAPKIFFIDNGIRNRMVHQFNDFELRADKGALLENWVFSELMKNSGYNDILYYWRSKGGAEVDFIRQHGNMLEGFEAKAGNMKLPKLSRSARSFIDAYSPEFFYVVNPNLRDNTSINSTVVKWVTYLDFVELIGN
ncbi:MAG: ATP-binding protein [Thermodesulfobacteriota bacterium]|nr:ATP-binding protein [Thermodesulfobacteriota bacterium]